MSKTIWRGYDFLPQDRPRECHRITPGGCNATVVPDSACFPVREAMAFCKEYAWSRYCKAVARMKAKKGSK
jgi:hypothetical protein